MSQIAPSYTIPLQKHVTVALKPPMQLCATRATTLDQSLRIIDRAAECLHGKELPQHLIGPELHSVALGGYHSHIKMPLPVDVHHIHHIQDVTSSTNASFSHTSWPLNVLASSTQSWHPGKPGSGKRLVGVFCPGSGVDEGPTLTKPPIFA